MPGPQHLEESVLRRILDDEPIGVAICDHVGTAFRYAYVNHAFQALRPHVPMAGRTYREVWPDLSIPFETLMQRVLDTGEPWTGENIPIEFGADTDHKDANYYTFNVSRLRGEKGPEVLVLARETSLEVKTAEHLRETDRRLRQALQAGRSGMFEWDLSKDSVYWSPELEAIYGLEPGEFDHSPAAAREAIYAEDRPAVLKRMEEGLAIGEWEAEHRIIHKKSGEIRWVYSRARVFYDQSRHPVRIVGFSTDITRVKRAEAKASEELETTSLLLQAADALSSWTDLDALLQGLTDIVLKAIPHRRVRVALLSEERDSIRFVAAAGGLNLSPGKEFELGELSPPMQEAYETGTPCIIDYDALSEERRGIARTLKTHISLVVPLVFAENVMGHFAVDDVDTRQPFTEREIHIATGIATQAAVAITNARLLESERRIAHFSTLLAETSSALSSAGDLDQVLSDVVRKIGEEIGAVGITLTLRRAGGWDVAHHWGIDELDRDFYSDEELPSHVRVVESGTPLVVEDVEEAEANRAVSEALGYRSFVIFPLVFHDEVIGTLDFGFGPARHAMSGREFDFMTRVAYVVSASMSNARLLRETARQAHFAEALNRINRAVHATVDFGEIMQRIVVDTAKALDVDATAVRMYRQGNWEFTYSHGLPETLLGTKSSASQSPISTLALEDKAIVISNDVASDPRANTPLMQQHDIRSLMTVPLAVHGEGLGVLIMCCVGRQCEFGAAEKDFAQKVAATLSLAVENARLYQTEHSIAETLQQALLAIPENVPGIDFGHLYRSATEATHVGGDFYDVVELDERRVGITIGDVAGKGLDAAVLTSLVKNTIRAHAVEQNKSPSAILALTNEVLYRATPAESFVTVFFAVLDRPSGRLVFANAGHATGMIARPDGETALLRSTGPLLGAFQDIEFDAAEVYLLAPDELFFLCTDGVTEARTDHDQFGEKRLADLLGTLVAKEPDEVVDAVLEEVLEFSHDRLRDDVAILALRRLEQDDVGPSQQRLEV